MEHDDVLPEFLTSSPLRDVHRLNDSEGKLYTAFHLGKGSPLQLMGPWVLWHGFRAFFKGARPGKMGKDIRQMPGTFIVSDGQIRVAFRSKNAADHPDLDAMAEEFQQHAS